MNIKTFNEVAERFVKSDILPQLKTPFSRFAVGAALGAGFVNAESFREMLEPIGVMKDDEIDANKLRDALEGGFDATPEIELNKFGVTLKFKREDADAFLRQLGA